MTELRLALADGVTIARRNVIKIRRVPEILCTDDLSESHRDRERLFGLELTVGGEETHPMHPDRRSPGDAGYLCGIRIECQPRRRDHAESDRVAIRIGYVRTVQIASVVIGRGGWCRVENGRSVDRRGGEPTTITAAASSASEEQKEPCGRSRPA